MVMWQRTIITFCQLYANRFSSAGLKYYELTWLSASGLRVCSSLTTIRYIWHPYETARTADKNNTCCNILFDLSALITASSKTIQWSYSVNWAFLRASTCALWGTAKCLLCCALQVLTQLLFLGWLTAHSRKITWFIWKKHWVTFLV